VAAPGSLPKVHKIFRLTEGHHLGALSFPVWIFLDDGDGDAIRFRPEGGRGIAAHYGRGFEASTAGSNLSPNTGTWRGESARHCDDEAEIVP